MQPTQVLLIYLLTGRTSASRLSQKVAEPSPFGVILVDEMYSVQIKFHSIIIYSIEN